LKYKKSFAYDNAFGLNWLFKPLKGEQEIDYKGTEQITD